MISDFKIREATIADLPTIASQRRAMFEDMGFTDPAVMDEVEKASAVWTGIRMRSGEYRAWLTVGPPHLKKPLPGREAGERGM